MKRFGLVISLVAVVTAIPANAGQVWFREGGRAVVVPVVVTPPSAAVEVVYEKKCSFDVIKLPAGIYMSNPEVTAQVAALWGSTNGQSNRWLYAHVAENCAASGGSVGYRYSWTTTAPAKFRDAVIPTGRATATVAADVLILNVTAPIWLSGEIASGIKLTRVK